MANNVTLSAGTADGAVIATDDIAGVHYQYNKIGIGADDTFTILAGGAGAVAAGVQRVTLASDDPAVASLAAMDTDLTTIIGHVDGLEGLLGTIDADTSGIITSVQLLDDTVVADDAAFTPATTKVIMAGFEYDDTLPDSVDEGDAGAARMSANRNQYVQIRDNAGNERGLNIDANGEIQISGTRNALAVTNAGLTELAAAINASSQMDVNIAASNAIITVASHAVTNAGTFAVQVDGAALTALQLIDDPVATLGTTTYTETTTKGMIIGAVRRDADTTLVDTTNEVSPLQVDANGRLKVEVFSGEALPVTLTSTTITGTVAVTQSGTWDEVGINDSGNSITVDNGGTFATQVDGAALTALQLIDDVVYTDDTSTHATGTSKGVLFMAAATPTDGSVNANDIAAVGMTVDRKLHVAVMDALPAGTAAIGKLAANSGVDIGDVDVTSISAGTNNIGNVGLIGRTTGGLTIFKSIDLDESEEEVKATAGQVFSISAFNHTAAPLFLKFYNLTAANTTVGTSTPVATFTVPGNADSDGAGFVWNNTIGLAFGTAISAAVTTAIADADTGAPAANACSVVIGYV